MPKVSSTYRRPVRSGPKRRRPAYRKVGANSHRVKHTDYFWAGSDAAEAQPEGRLMQGAEIFLPGILLLTIADVCLHFIVRFF